MPRPQLRRTRSAWQPTTTAMSSMPQSRNRAICRSTRVIPPIRTRHFGSVPAVPFRRAPLPAARMTPLNGPSPPSLRTLSEEDHLDRVEDDRQVENDRHVLDVVEVVAQLLHRVFDGRSVLILDLRPASDPRLDRMPLHVERNIARQLLDEERPFR